MVHFPGDSPIWLSLRARQLTFSRVSRYPYSDPRSWCCSRGHTIYSMENSHKGTAPADAPPSSSLDTVVCLITQRRDNGTAPHSSLFLPCPCPGATFSAATFPDKTWTNVCSPRQGQGQTKETIPSKSSLVKEWVCWAESSMGKEWHGCRWPQNRSMGGKSHLRVMTSHTWSTFQQAFQPFYSSTSWDYVSLGRVVGHRRLRVNLLMALSPPVQGLIDPVLRGSLCHA